MFIDVVFPGYIPDFDLGSFKFLLFVSVVTFSPKKNKIKLTLYFAGAESQDRYFRAFDIILQKFPYFQFFVGGRFTLGERR